jgi:hypothetical protein
MDKGKVMRKIRGQKSSLLILDEFDKEADSKIAKEILKKDEVVVDNRIVYDIIEENGKTKCVCRQE